MKMNKPLFPLLGQLVSRQADSESVELPEEASPLDFLTAVYRSPQQPIGRRLNAAIAAAPFMHAKLTVNATMDNESFAKQMEDMMKRSGRSCVIDATSNYTQLKPE
jgi:hypothetical protein